MFRASFTGRIELEFKQEKEKYHRVGGDVQTTVLSQEGLWYVQGQQRNPGEKCWELGPESPMAAWKVGFLPHGHGISEGPSRGRNPCRAGNGEAGQAMLALRVTYLAVLGFTRSPQKRSH